MSRVVNNKAIKSNRVRLERTCISCRARMSKPNLLRIVKCEGNIAIDIHHDIPGRGCYVCNNASCIEKINTKKALNRVYKRNINQLVYDRLKEVFNSIN